MIDLIRNITLLLAGRAGIEGLPGALPPNDESELKSDITLIVLDLGYRVCDSSIWCRCH